MGKKLKTVELFSGIGGFRIALERAGVDTIWANDFDAMASKVYRDRFGEKGYVEGDIWKLIDDVPSHDILTGGFPCQPFSSAGKKKGIEDPRGTLFEAIVKILGKNQPDYFILENVKRLLLMDSGKHFATILDALASLNYRIEWRVLNASYFGLPQNRQRIFITGVHERVLEREGTKADDVRAIRLATTEDLDSLVDSKKAQIVNYDDWQSIAEHGRLFNNWGIACKNKFVTAELKNFSEKTETVLLKSVIEKNASDIFDLTESTEERLKNTRLIRKMINDVEVVGNQSGGARMGYTVYGVNGLAPTLTSSTSRHYERYAIDGRYRRLTNNEYARIQGFPDNHCSSAPLRHEYVMYGNAVPPNMVEWVAKRLLKNDLRTKIELKESKLPLEYAK